MSISILYLSLLQFYIRSSYLCTLKKTCSKLSVSKNCRMAQDSVWKYRPFSVFVDEFVSHFALLQYVVQQPPCLVIFETSKSNRKMAAILNLLMLSDLEDGY